MKLAILGFLSDAAGQRLNLQAFAVQATRLAVARPWTIAVCGASMDAGKTYTVASIIRGLAAAGYRVGAAKLTGTASGRDVWQYLDAGAFPVFDFSDCGLPSTYGCTQDDLVRIHTTLASKLADAGVECVVFEIADGVLQQESEALLRAPAFRRNVDQFVYAAADPLSAVGGIVCLRTWGIQPGAISGRVSMSPLAIREVERATETRCLTARQLADGALNDSPLAPRRSAVRPPVVSGNGHRNGVAALAG
jgi:hypothetical protein